MSSFAIMKIITLDIIIYNNWDIDTAVKTMLGYVRPIMTPVIEARQKQAEEEFEKMMNPPAEEKVEDTPADKQLMSRLV